jgi:hypothetical protein
VVIGVIGFLPSGVAGALAVPTARIGGALAVNPPMRIGAWVYPGESGQATCRVPSELAGLPPRSPGVVKPQFLEVAPDGDVVVVRAARQPCNGYSRRELARLRAGGRRIVVSVVGGTPGVDALLGSPVRQAAAERTIAGFVTTTGASGAELDFEPAAWSPPEWASYMTFVAALVPMLHGHALEVDMSAWTTTPPDAERYADPVLAGARLVVMAFDHQYVQPCSAIAPFRWIRQVVAYVRSQVPLGDVTIGLPSYGYRASSCTSPSAIRDNIPYVTMEQQPGFPAAGQAPAHRDPASAELRWKVGRVQYDVVDATALRAKLRLVESLGVTSVSIWALGGNAWITGNPS